MTKASKLSWTVGETVSVLYGDSKYQHDYPYGSVSLIVNTHHAYVRTELFEPMKFMASFPTQDEAMAFVNLMVGSTDYV